MPTTLGNFRRKAGASLCFLVVCAVSSPKAQQVAKPDGYGAKATGGGTAAPITVSTAAAFKTAAGNDNPAVILVEGKLNIGEFAIGSNKTILGKDARSGLYGGRVRVTGDNYIIQNLIIGPSPTDAMELSGATNVFIHKCEFYDGADGSLDIVRQSDSVTVSWSKFYYVDQTTHKNTVLIGNGDDVTADAGKLRVTMHHNWFAEKCHERMPRVRFGQVHIYNNYYNSTGSLYAIGTGVHCRIRVENSHFDDISAPWRDYDGMANDGRIGWTGLSFTGAASQPTYAANTFPVFTPPYTFTMDPVGQVKERVRAGAGNVFGGGTSSVQHRAAPQSHRWKIHSLSGNLGEAGFAGNAGILAYDSRGRLVMRETGSGKAHGFDFGKASSGAYLVSGR